MFTSIVRSSRVPTRWVWRCYSNNAPPPLQILRRNGVINFVLPLPNKEKCSFPLYPNETVNDLIVDILEEDREKSNVDIKDVNGTTIAHSTPISDLIKRPFVISIDGKDNYSVVVPDVQSQSDTENGVSHPDIEDLVRKALFQQVRKKLFEKDLHHIMYSHYIDICKDYGLSETEGADYLRALHLSGYVFHFHSNQHIKDYIFLKPEQVTNAITSLLGIKFHPRPISEVKSELESLLQKYIPLNTRKIDLDRKAHTTAKWTMNFGLGYLCVQSVGLGHMVWYDYSWGVMEPVTYFVFLTTLIGGLFFFIISNQEFTYYALEQRQFRKALKKIVHQQKKSFQLEKVERVGRKGVEVERDFG